MLVTDERDFASSDGLKENNFHVVKERRPLKNYLVHHLTGVACYCPLSADLLDGSGRKGD